MNIFRVSFMVTCCDHVVLLIIYYNWITQLKKYLNDSADWIFLIFIILFPFWGLVYQLSQFSQSRMHLFHWISLGVAVSHVKYCICFEPQDVDWTSEEGLTSRYTTRKMNFTAGVYQISVGLYESKFHACQSFNKLRILNSVGFKI